MTAFCKSSPRLPNGNDVVNLVHEPIAVVGAACRLPGADNLDTLWSLLSEGQESIRPLPENRFPLREYWHPRRGEPGKFYATRAGTLDDIELFDAAFFGISTREAKEMDPQQRLLLELAWEALEDGGIQPSRIADAGVYVGASATEYANARLGDPNSIGPYFMPGNTLSIFSNRISYMLDLHGPSMTVDTACSSSLFALHLACQDLQKGRTSAALVGGVNMLLSPYPFIGFCSASMLSPTGHCHAFDAAADGYVRAEGGAMLLLKRLSTAQQDGDSIYGVILGSAVNTDGHTQGMLFPGVTAQSDLLDRLYSDTGISGNQLAFVEAHGTGTAAGDPVEATALGTILGRGRTSPLPIGSIKSNIGHLEPASGLAGILKALLAFQHRSLPASLHYQTPSPHIDFGSLNLQVASTPCELSGNRLLAGVNNFGFGGANAHVILAEPPSGYANAAPDSDDCTAQLPLLLSARSKAALRALAARWVTMPWDASALRGLARRRVHHPYRLGILPGNDEQMRAALAACAQGKPNDHAVDGHAIPAARMVFVFSGNGSQFPEMGQDLLACSTEFHDGVAAADAALRPHLGWSVLESMRDGSWNNGRAESEQPILFAFQVGLLSGLQHEGVVPDAVLGHSVGELAAAYCAGSLDLDEAARIVVLRSRYQEMAAGGGMAVLHCAAGTAEILISENALNVAIAADNAPNSVSVAGSVRGLEALETVAREHGIRTQRLGINYAFHSAEMEPVREPLLTALGEIVSTQPVCEFVSTVTGAARTDPFDTSYWWHNVRDPVLFQQAAGYVARHDNCILLEIGPRPILQHYLREIAHESGRQSRILATTRRNNTGNPFPRIRLACYAAGFDITQDGSFAGMAQVRGLPRIQWQKERYWYTPSDSAVLTLWDQDITHPLLCTRGEEHPQEWIAQLDTTVQPWLADHVVNGGPILAAACLIEFAFAAGRSLFPTATTLELDDFQILRPVVLEADHLREIRVRVDSSHMVTIESRPRLRDAAWALHASGQISLSPVAPSDLPIGDVTGMLSETALYAQAKELGLDYGPQFRRVESVTINGLDTARSQLKPGNVLPGLALDPAALDGAFQTLIALAVKHGNLDATTAPLPQRFGRIRLAMNGGIPVSSGVCIRIAGIRELKADISLRDISGKPVFSAESCWFVRMPAEVPLPVAERSFHENWMAAPPSPAEWSDDRFLAMRPVMSGTTVGSENDKENRLLATAFLQACSINILEKCPAGFEGHEAVAPLLSILQELAESARDIDLPTAATIWQTLFFDSQDWLAASLLLAWMEERMTALVCCPDHSDTSAKTLPVGILRQFLSGRPALLAATMLSDAIAAFVKAWPSDRPLRILEVHSEHGSLARNLYPLLRTIVPDVEYTIVEPDDKRQRHLRSELLSHLSGIAIVSDVPPRSQDLIVTYASGIRSIAPSALLDTAAALVHGGTILAVEASDAPEWKILQLLSEQSLLSIRAWHNLPHQLRLAAEGNATLTPFPFVLFAVSPEDTEHSADKESTEPPEEIAASPPLICRRPASTITESKQHALTDALMALVDQARHAVANDAQLILITRGEDTDPVEAARAAFARVMANELPALRCKRLELCPDLADIDAQRCLAAELQTHDNEREVRWNESGRWVRRLREGLPLRHSTAAAASLCLHQPMPGPLDRLCWEATKPVQPGPRDVTLRVMASGLNYRDVLSAIGMLPEELLIDGFAGATLGMECTGIVEAVGDAVTDIAVGDHVMALAAAAHATRVVTDMDSVLPLPASVSFAEGATVPVAFLTVLYALETIGTLQKDETVLIHGAAGGVGLAAVQYAAHIGARVIATAGSPVKRAALRHLGIEVVLDSRSLTFAAEIEAATAGQGVDVVLNALSGEAMERSLTLLRPFGRFLELGKRDFLANTRVGLAPLRRNVSYHAIDIDALVRHRPALVRALMVKLHTLLEERAIIPLPYTSFPFSEAEQAFVLMRASGHVGKIVLTADDVRAPSAIVIPANRTVLVTGGTSGFGSETARWLVRAGAKHIVLVSRRGASTPGYLSLYDALLKAGALNVEAHSCDVGDRDQLAGMLDSVRSRLPPIGAVVHAAAVVSDGLVMSLTPQQIEDSVHAKLDGTMALDELTRSDPLSLFLVFSSATVTLGAPGQGTYVAVNAAIEAIIRKRHAVGLPGCAVRWGPISDAGLLERDAVARSALSRRLGARPMRARDALDALPMLLDSEETTPVLAEVDWQTVSGTLPIVMEPIFATLTHRGSSEGQTDDFLTHLEGLDSQARHTAITDLILDELTRITQNERQTLSVKQPLSDLGMDSLTAMELALGLERRLGVTMPGFAWQEMTIEHVARQVINILYGSSAIATTTTVAERHLSEDQKEIVAHMHNHAMHASDLAHPTGAAQ